MFKHAECKSLDDFFKVLSDRTENNVFFYRIYGYNDQIDTFIRAYYETAKNHGVIIEGRIPNPTEQNLSYYEEMLGNDFTLSMEFITSRLKKWMPRLTSVQNASLSTAICQSLNQLKQSGKNDSMIRNAYVKIMCWLYYRFERIVVQLGNQTIPKILYTGNISNYELIMLNILSVSGCDIVLLEYDGDGNYLKLDPNSSLSNALSMANMTAFPPGFNLHEMSQNAKIIPTPVNAGSATNKENNKIPFRSTITLHSNRPVQENPVVSKEPDSNRCTNEWLKHKGNLFEDIMTPPSSRGNDSRFYNCFIRMCGVNDRLTYQNDLYGIYHAFKSNRNIIIIDDTIPPPTIDEIALIRRKNTYQNKEQLLVDLINNIVSPSTLLQEMIRNSFTHVMDIDLPLNKLVNIGVTLLCWIKRYIPTLFNKWKSPEVECFIHFGSCKNDKEALFLSLLAKLPTDVLIFVPNPDEPCMLIDTLLYEQKFTMGMDIAKFPKEVTDMQIGTTAYHAEKDLNSLIYQNTGIYKPNQFKKANSLILKTMYEEIPILWNQEAKYRPNFSATDVVNIPVIFAKISGVKKVNSYWKQIRSLSRDAYLKVESYLERNENNPFITYAGSFIKDGKILKDRIRDHPGYRYGFLRMDMQEHLFDKMQLLLDQNLIRGTGEVRTNSIIVASILNMDHQIIRMLQDFDFTRHNPKIVYVNTGERTISIEDAIVIAFLNLVGFDILMFIPTGYACAENYYNSIPFEEHLIGNYAYDLQIPELKTTPKNRFIKKIFS